MRGSLSSGQQVPLGVALDHVVENAVVTEYGDDAGEDDVKFVTDRSASKEDTDKAAETE